MTDLRDVDPRHRMYVPGPVGGLLPESLRGRALEAANAGRRAGVTPRQWRARFVLVVAGCVGFTVGVLFAHVWWAALAGAMVAALGWTLGSAGFRRLVWSPVARPVAGAVPLTAGARAASRAAARITGTRVWRRDVFGHRGRFDPWAEAGQIKTRLGQIAQARAQVFAVAAGAFDAAERAELVESIDQQTAGVLERVSRLVAYAEQVERADRAVMTLEQIPEATAAREAVTALAGTGGDHVEPVGGVGSCERTLAAVRGDADAALVAVMGDPA